MSKTYNVTREVASKSLNISTRTIDRYIKSGKLSYTTLYGKIFYFRQEIAGILIANTKKRRG